MTTGPYMIPSPIKSRNKSVLVILSCLCLTKAQALGYLEQLSVQEQGVGSLCEVLTVCVQVPELVQIPGQSKTIPWCEGLLCPRELQGHKGLLRTQPT